jgi:hypothetical protein
LISANVANNQHPRRNSAGRASANLLAGRRFHGANARRLSWRPTVRGFENGRQEEKLVVDLPGDNSCMKHVLIVVD